MTNLKDKKNGQEDNFNHALQEPAKPTQHSQIQTEPCLCEICLNARHEELLRVREFFQKEREELRGKIEKMKKTQHMEACEIKQVDPQICGWCLGHNLLYNQAISDILNLLTK